MKFRITSFSLPYRDLMINLLSAEKKKKEPLAPAPCPALNTFCLFIWGSRDVRMSLQVTPPKAIMISNYS
jgi:hypothetical protein